MPLLDNAIPFLLFPPDCNSPHYIFSSWHVAWHKEDAMGGRKSHPPTSLYHLLKLNYHIPHPESDRPFNPFSIQQLECPSQSTNLSMSPPILNILWEASHVALGKLNSYHDLQGRPAWSGPRQLLQLVSYHAFPHTLSAAAKLTSFRPSNRRLPW